MNWNNGALVTLILLLLTGLYLFVLPHVTNTRSRRRRSWHQSTWRNES
jgi:hypothetical protein